MITLNGSFQISVFIVCHILIRRFLMKLRFLLLFFILFSSLANAQETMKFVYYDNYYPRSWLEAGKMKGILVDIVEEALGKRLGIEVSHTGYPWKRAQYMVSNNMADAFVTVPTQERRSYSVIVNEPAIVFSIRPLTRKHYARTHELEKITTLEELKGYKIVDYSGNGWANLKMKGMDVSWLPNIDAIFPFILLGRADVILASNRTICRMKQLGYASQFTLLSNTLDSVDFHICIGKNTHFKEKIADIDHTIREMRNDGTIDRIVKKYYR